MAKNSTVCLVASMVEISLLTKKHGLLLLCQVHVRPTFKCRGTFCVIVCCETCSNNDEYYTREKTQKTQWFGNVSTLTRARIFASLYVILGLPNV
jgi:hypothetical protein